MTLGQITTNMKSKKVRREKLFSNEELGMRNYFPFPIFHFPFEKFSISISCAVFFSIFHLKYNHGKSNHK